MSKLLNSFENNESLSIFSMDEEMVLIVLEAFNKNSFEKNKIPSGLY